MNGGTVLKKKLVKKARFWTFRPKNGKILAIFWSKITKIEKFQRKSNSFIDVSINEDGLNESYDELRHSFKEIGK